MNRVIRRGGRQRITNSTYTMRVNGAIMRHREKRGKGANEIN